MSNITEPKAIAVDFDKTICDSKYPELGPAMPGAKEALTILRSLGYKIIISSCRASNMHWDLYYPDTPFTPAVERPVYKAMVDWLKLNEIPYDILDDGTLGKVSAEYYIDDKGLRFENNWDAIVFAIHQKQIQDKTNAAQAQQQLQQKQMAQQFLQQRG